MQLKAQFFGGTCVCGLIIAGALFSYGTYAAVTGSGELKLSTRNHEIGGEIVGELLQRIEYLESEMRVLRAELEGKTFSLDRSLREVKLHITNFSDVIDSAESPLNPNAVSEISVEASLQKVEIDRQNSDEESLVLSGAPDEPYLLEEEPTVFDPDTLYGKGAESFKTGSYQEAIDAYTSFIRSHPGDTRVGGATYRLGETYYQLRLFQEAILQYERLIETFPEEAVKPHAMLKLAYCYYEIGESEKALVILERIKLFFPGSKVAELSEQRLKRLMVGPP